MTMQANLTNRDATRVPHPFVKWSYEPPRAEDVPLALAHAIHLASLPPRGPVFVSMPMDDWDVEVDAAEARPCRSTAAWTAAPAPTRQAVERPRRSGSTGAKNPVLVAGPDIDAAGAWDDAVALAERQNLPVWASPAPGGGRLGFPEGHPHFRGVLPPAIGPVGETLKGHDLILVVGSSVFPYYPYIPGPLLPEGAALVAITSDPDEAARAPMGDAIVADVAPDPGGAARGGARDRARPAPEPDPGPEPIPARRPTRSTLDRPHALARGLPRRTGSSCSSRPPAPCRCATSCGSRSRAATSSAPAADSASASPPSIGVQLAQPDRPVVCVLGEGSAQYAITGLLDGRRLRRARSPSSSCATRSTRSSSGSRRSSR